MEIQENKNLLNCYKEEDIKELLNNDTRLVYVDTGMEEFVAKYEDLPDIIVDIDNKLNHSVNLKGYDFNNPDMCNPLLTTIGCFLDRCQLDVRNDIIDRLIKLQTENETIKEYKVIDEDMLDEVRVSLNKDDEMER